MPGEHITALVRSHASGDDAVFYSVALQAAAREARAGHAAMADDIKKAVDASRKAVPRHSVTKLAQPRGDLADLMTVTHPDVVLKDLIGPASLVTQVEQVIAEQRQRRRLLDHGFAPAHRLLLEGPPGTGKTMTAAVLARELALPLFTVRLDALLSKFMGETAGRLRIIFDAASERRGVYLFDEFDALGADRSSNDVGEARRILNTFLVLLEEANEESLLVAATNHRSILDRALFRRFDAALTYHLPDAKQATSVMRARLGSLAKGLSFAGMAEHYEGLSHADLVRAAETAAKAVVMRGESGVTREDLLRGLELRRLGARG